MSIVWLASYPKSGNTWFRALLTNYLQGGPPASVNALVGAWEANDRDMFNELVGLDSSELTADELLRHQLAFHALLAEALPSPTFMKVHEAFLPVPAPTNDNPMAADPLAADALAQPTPSRCRRRAANLVAPAMGIAEKDGFDAHKLFPPPHCRRIPSAVTVPCIDSARSSVG